jgi:hypothetical protein
MPAGDVIARGVLRAVPDRDPGLLIERPRLCTVE